MTLEEKVLLLRENYPLEFEKTRSEVFNQLSDMQPLVCVCGSIATYFHERSCEKFNNAVDRKTCILLEHLIQKECDLRKRKMTLLDIIRLADWGGANIADGKVLVKLIGGRKITLFDVYVDEEENIVLLERREEE